MSDPKEIKVSPQMLLKLKQELEKPTPANDYLRKVLAKYRKRTTQ